MVDIDPKNPNWTVQDLKANFLSKERNKTIIGLIVTLTLLSGIYMLYAASEGRSDGDGIVPSLLYIVVSLGIIMWYYLQSSGAFYISAFIAVVATAIFIMDIRMFSPFDIIPSMVNVVLFHALYHFHEYEITTGEDDIPSYADTDVEGGIGADLEQDQV